MGTLVCVLPLAMALLFTYVEASAQTAPAPLRSRVAQVVARDLGVEAEQARGLDVQLLAPGLELSDDVGLRVADVRSGGKPNVWLLRLECDSRTRCLPFEVAMRASAFTAAKKLTTAQQPGQHAEPVVRPGQKVTLTEELSGLHLTTSGISLQTGSVGQRIRVRNAASGRVVVARVSDRTNVVVEQ